MNIFKALKALFVQEVPEDKIMCTSCGKDDFKTIRGLRQHVTKKRKFGCPSHQLKKRNS